MINAEAATAQSATIQPLRILVVDDNHESAQTLAWMLEALGHDIQMAGNGLQALQISDSFMPHVVLLDIGLPDINGYEVCRRMRENPKFQGVVFIAQTGWDYALFPEAIQTIQFNHYLVKPITFENLTKLLMPINPA